MNATEKIPHSDKPGEDSSALKDGDDKYRRLIYQMPQGFCIIEVVFDNKENAIDYIFREINPAFMENSILGNPVGKSMKELAPRHEENWFKAYGDVVKTGKPVHFIMEARFIGDYQYEIFALPAGNGNSNEVAVFFTDITESNRTRELEKKEIELEDYQRQVLLRATLNAQEEERRRIAENLHNGLGQLLFGVKLSLAAARKKAEPEVSSMLVETEQLLTSAIAASRKISHELMPSVIEDYGLESAILDICRQWEDSLNIKCFFNGIPTQLDKYLELAIYRILQELAQNIIKHAEAKHAEIRLKAKGNNIEITVSDNGRGFDTQDMTAAGIGLKTIRNKVKLLKGSFAIISTPGNGTEIQVSIPFRSYHLKDKL